MIEVHPNLFLNIIDARDPALFVKEAIDAALDFIDEALAKGLKVLVHCDRGDSRSPAIVFLLHGNPTWHAAGRVIRSSRGAIQDTLSQLQS